MLFHVFELKVLCCPKDMSALDDLVHDFVYCLQLSLVLKALRLFPWLLRFPRREKSHGYWTPLCLQRAREAKRCWGAIPRAFAVSGCVITALAFQGRDGRAVPGSLRGARRACPVSLLPRISPISRDRFGSDSRFSIRPTFLPSHSKRSSKCKHTKCLNWAFHSR